LLPNPSKTATNFSTKIPKNFEIDQQKNCSLTHKTINLNCQDPAKKYSKKDEEEIGLTLESKVKERKWLLDLQKKFVFSFY
jgi:hypothetical protein